MEDHFVENRFNSSTSMLGNEFGISELEKKGNFFFKTKLNIKSKLSITNEMLKKNRFSFFWKKLYYSHLTFCI